MRLFVFLLVCMSLLLLVQSAIAQKTPSDTERDAFIHNEIEKQRARLSSSNMEERWDAVIQLRFLNAPESSRIAAIGLNDPVDIIRASAVYSILALPSDEAASLLLPLLNDKSEFVRKETAYALGETRSITAAPKLAAIVSSKKEHLSVRCASVVSLGLIGEASSASTLIQLLQNKKENNEFLIRATARSLGQIRSREAVPLLISLLSNDKTNEDIRREAARALGLIGDSSAIPYLQSAFHSNDPYLSSIAEEALKGFKSN